jgi:hypothetical protein
MKNSPNLDLIGQNLVRIAHDVTLKDMLMAFDEVLEETGIYAYQNWIDGELCEGPEVSRYWFTTTWMWPKRLMPNPDAGLRLTDKGAKVYFYEDKYVESIKVKSPRDIDAQTHRAKEIAHDVWCVKIEMPRRLIDGKLEDIIDLEDTIEIDVSHIDSAYEQQEPEVVEQEQVEEPDFDDDFDLEEEL